MREVTCPVCFTPMTIRDVAPCFVCGGWPESIADSETKREFSEYRMPNQRKIILCSSCRLEEFMVHDGWGFRVLPGEKLPINGLQRIRDVEAARLGRDDFCESCNLRGAFLKLIASTFE